MVLYMHKHVLLKVKYVYSYIFPHVLLYGPGNRTSPEFQKLLGIAMEMFLLCSDDSESDVRMVADECLNKIIKVSNTPANLSIFLHPYLNKEDHKPHSG